MSFSQSIADQFRTLATAGVSFENEDGELVELDAEILQEAGEEAGELVELSSEINQAARAAVAMESLLASFQAKGECTQESHAQYVASMEALLISANIPFNAASLAPSFESSKTWYEYSVEAEEKADGTLQAMWKWIQEKWKQLVAFIKKLFNRTEQQADALIKKADAVAEKAKDVKGSDPISLPAAAAKYLVDANGNPMTLTKAIGEFNAAGAGNSPAHKFALDYTTAALKANIAGLNAAARSGSHRIFGGWQLEVAPGASAQVPAVGAKVSLKAPKVGGDLKFPPLNGSDITRGLAALKSSLESFKAKAKQPNYMDLSDAAAAKIDKALEKAVGNTKGQGSRKVIADLRGAIGTYISNAGALSKGINDTIVRSGQAILVYANKAAAGGGEAAAE